MNHEGIVIQLHRLCNRISSACLKLDFDPVKTDTQEFDALLSLAKDWGQQLTLIERNMKNRENLIALEAEKNRFGAGSYQSKQRASSLTENVAEIRQAALAVAAALADLIAKIYAGPSDTQKSLDSIAEILEEMAGATTKEVATELSLGIGDHSATLVATIKQATPSGAGPVVLPINGLGVFMLIFALTALLISLRNERRR